MQMAASGLFPLVLSEGVSIKVLGNNVSSCYSFVFLEMMDRVRETMVCGPALDYYFLGPLMTI
jgi:hypothetical protein